MQRARMLKTRDEIVLPDRGRPLKSRYILRLIALTRAFNVLVLALVLGFWFLSQRGERR